MDAGRDLTIEVACHNWTKDRLIMTSRQGEHVGDRWICMSFARKRGRSLKIRVAGDKLQSGA